MASSNKHHFPFFFHIHVNLHILFVTCAFPGALQHAAFGYNALHDGTDLPYQSLITITCHPGYEVSPSQESYTSTCDEPGWTPIIQDCQAKQCDMARPLDTDGPDRVVGPYTAMVNITCLPDKVTHNLGPDVITQATYRDLYASNELITEYVTTCEATGQWDNQMNCKPRFGCSDPAPANTTLTVVTGAIDDLVTIRCLPGHVAAGSQLTEYDARCLITGNWDRLRPCEHDPDGNTFAIPHSDITLTSCSHGQKITGLCDLGYETENLRANFTIACPLKSGNLTMCFRQTCTLHIFDSNANNVKRLYGDTVNVRCRTGFNFPTQNDTMTTQCLPNNQWSLTDVCTKRSCHGMGPNGTLQAELMLDGEYNTSKQVKCNPGHLTTNKQNDYITFCTESGTWSRLDGCNLVKCAADGDSQFSEELPVAAWGTNISVTCRPGYELPDGNTRQLATCLTENSVVKWKYKYCVGVLGATLRAPESNATNTTARYPKELAVSCDDGFWLVNHRRTYTTRLGPDGSWTNDLGCRRITCPSLAVANSNVTTTLRDVESGWGVYITCRHGYEVNRQPGFNVLCDADGNWTDIGTCSKISCSLAVDYSNYEDHVSVLYGDNVTVVCHKGYVIEGSSTSVTLTCQWNKTWDRKISCQAIDCPALPSFPSVRPVGPVNTTLGSVVAFLCSQDYGPIGNLSTAKCRPDKTWSDIPKCPKMCPPLPSFSHGNISNLERVVGMRVTFVCDDDYELKGVEQVTCTVVGEWSSVAPLCVAEVVIVEGQWGNWTEWVHVDRACGNKTRSRTRECLTGTSCIGASLEEENYRTIPVPVNGSITTWGDWGPCGRLNTSSCVLSRYRRKIPPLCGGHPSKESTVDTEICNCSISTDTSPGRPNKLRLANMDKAENSVLGIAITVTVFGCISIVVTFDLVVNVAQIKWKAPSSTWRQYQP